jgi:Uma2 family endonuclease
MSTFTRQSRNVEPVANKTAVTGDDLLAMGDIGRVELVKGEIIELMPTGSRHAKIEGLITFFLINFLRTYNLGHILTGEAGIFTRRNPDTIRGMDIAFISNERMAQAQEEGFLDVAPEFIVEIMSPIDRWIDIQEKLAEYFSIGVELVWLVDPQLEQIHVYRSLDNVSRLMAEHTLTAPEILPDFSVPITEIFEITEDE